MAISRRSVPTAQECVTSKPNQKPACSQYPSFFQTGYSFSSTAQFTRSGSGIIRAFAAHQPPIPTLLVHTGQHYDPAMKDRLFADLDLPEPDVNLAVGSGSHAVQTAEVMKRFEPVIDQHGARAVLVVGTLGLLVVTSLFSRTNRSLYDKWCGSSVIYDWRPSLPGSTPAS